LEFKRAVWAGHINVGLISIGMLFKAMIPGRCIRREKRGGLWIELWALQHLEVRRRKRIRQKAIEKEQKLVSYEETSRARGPRSKVCQGRESD